MVSFESLFIFLSIGTLFVMIAWQERAQSEILDAMSKNKCSKIAPLFEIQYDVLFQRISVQWMGSRYACIRSQKESAKLDIAISMHFP